jgi:hypothetical protein
MSGFSSFKNSKILFENWRSHVNEELTQKVAQELGDFAQMSDEEKQAFMGAAMSKEENPMSLTEDGHTDVASAIRKLKVACENAQDLLEVLSQMPPEGDLPSWWMSKAAIASNYISKMRDYLVYPSEQQVKQPLEEKKEDCFARGAYKTFEGKSKCIQKTKGLPKERADAYVAKVLRQMGEID